MDTDKKMSVEKIYQKKTQLEHILLRPDTYVGSMERLEQEMWIWDFENEKMIKKEIQYVPGLFKIFDEILVNAADNKVRDPSMTMLKINIDKEANMIKVFNNGKGIPIVEHKDEKMFVPSLIFGHLLTSSNYNDDEKKVTGGRNGYGAKLCNIFSKKFIVETSCKDSKKFFKQTWLENMAKTNKPTIKPNKDDDFTCITFYPDLAKFGMTRLEEDTIGLLARRAYDVAASTRGVKVYLNNKRLPISKFEDYCKLYVVNNTGGDDNDILNSSIGGSGAGKILYESPNPRWEIAVSYSDIGFQQVSFVNSIATTKGGRHVDYICEQIIKSLAEVVNKKSGKNTTNIRPFQIKNHLWLFVNCLIENPVFESQTKECMSLQVKNFGSKCQLSEEFVKKIAQKSGIVDRVLNWLAFKDKTDLEKTGSKTKHIKIKGIPKLDDANNAGTKDSMNCTLILTEGDSAKTLAVAGLGVIGRDRYGVFPLRGKMLNVREATTKQILENAEVTSILKIIGLNFKEKYVSRDSMKGLRYGKIMIMTDQDQDGSHIKGLIINFIHFQWPNLLKHGFVEEFITPIIKVTKSTKKEDKIEKSFYSMPEFNEWQQSTPDWHTWKLKYYKGLGTSTSKEAKEYFSDMQRHCIKFEHSGVRDDLAIQLAFSKKLAEDRKEWLTRFMQRRHGQQTYLYHKNTRKINYSEFVNKELVLFSNLDNERSIPSLVDGFKPGQRKVLFACIKRNLQKEIKVAQLAGSVAELSAYHHGEQSLMGTIINLAQNFVGSNNCNILMPIGQFGTRLHGGKDAASPRYIFTNLSSLTRLLYNQKDDPLFEYVNDDGQRVEPEHYCPIIPMVLVNGAEGIGTGWASKIPNFNIRTIISNIKRLINKEDPLPMKPHYKNFRGNIDQIDESKFLISGEVAIIENESHNKNEYSIEISELPIGTWTQVYKETVLEVFLHGPDSANAGSLAKQGLTQLINDYKEYHTDCTVRFVVKMTSKQFDYAMGQGGLHKFFKLQKTVSLNNMVLFDSKGCLRRFETAMDILREFYEIRLSYYVKRKAYILDMLGAECAKLDNVARFIVEKIEGKVKVENLKKKDLIEMLASRGYESDPIRKWKEKITHERGYLHETLADTTEPDDLTNPNENKKDFNYFLSMPLWNLTLEKKEEILKQQREKKAELKNLLSKSPEQLWLSDIDEFEKELERVEAQEKAEFETTAKKTSNRQEKAAKSSGFNVNKFLKRNSGSSVNYEYMPSVTGERVMPQIDPQLIDKSQKETLQKDLLKIGKKDADTKNLSLVDVISNETGVFDEDEMKQVNAIAEAITNPNKSRASKPVSEKVKEKKSKPEILSPLNGNGHIENGNDLTDTMATDPVNGLANDSAKVKKSIDKNSANKDTESKTPKLKKEKLKITMNSDSEASFDEDLIEAVESFIDRRHTKRQKKSVKYVSANSETESSEDESKFVSVKTEDKELDLDVSVLSDPVIDEKNDSDAEEVTLSDAEEKSNKTKKKVPKKMPNKSTPKKAGKTSNVVDNSASEVSWPSSESSPEIEKVEKKKKAAKPVKKLGAKKPPVKKATPKRKSAEIVIDSDDSEDDVEVVAEIKKKKPVAARKATKKKASDDDFGSPRKKVSKARKPRKKAIANVDDDDDDENSDFSLD